MSDPAPKKEKTGFPWEWFFGIFLVLILIPTGLTSCADGVASSAQRGYGSRMAISWTLDTIGMTILAAILLAWIGAAVVAKVRGGGGGGHH